jgi:hypothetical protein
VKTILNRYQSVSAWPKLARQSKHILPADKTIGWLRLALLLRFVCGNPPGIGRGVNETTLAFLIRLIRDRGDLLGFKLNGSLENCLEIATEIPRTWKTTSSARPPICESGKRKSATTFHLSPILVAVVFHQYDELGLSGQFVDSLIYSQTFRRRVDNEPFDKASIEFVKS